jgi:membrane protease YdiL (CAAX protease family)
MPQAIDGPWHRVRSGHVDLRAAVPPASPRPSGAGTLVGTWALALGGLLVARLLARVEPTGLLAGNLAGVAAVLFVLLPDARLRARGEAWASYGVPVLGGERGWADLALGAWQGLLACALVFPPFVAAFIGFTSLVPRLPAGLAAALSPYLGAPAFAFRLPGSLALTIALQLLVVALPEELFYRGWMQTAWARLRPDRGFTVLGARLGHGFLTTQLLFAAGHLVSGQPWRLATFFPGLLFGWLRARTGSVVAPIVAHALSNLLILTLERSFYP